MDWEEQRSELRKRFDELCRLVNSNAPQAEKDAAHHAWMESLNDNRDKIVTDMNRQGLDGQKFLQWLGFYFRGMLEDYRRLSVEVLAEMDSEALQPKLIEPLGDKDKRILRAMLLDSVFIDNPQSAVIICAEAGVGDHKKAMSTLRVNGLVDTKPGPYGWWLTDFGTQVAKKLPPPT